MFQADSFSFFALFAMGLCWVLAVVLYRVGTPGSVARKLSLLLVVESITLISTGYLDLLLTPEATAQSWYPTWFQAETVVHTMGDCLMLVLYPPFLAAALQTPLTRPFANRKVQAFVTAVAAVAFFIVIFGPLKLGGTLLYILLVLLFGFSLVASIQAWRSAVGSARARARSFAIAFGIRDVLWGICYGAATLQIWSETYSVVATDEAVNSFLYIIYAGGTLLSVPLIAYGILYSQLFDIDLKIRWTIRQSTLAAAMVTVFSVLSEVAERFLSSELGDYAGLLSATLVIVFLSPLQRFAERVARIVMPNTQNTPEYLAHRKLQVYEAALIEARISDGISPKERILLNSLRDSLGISPLDAEALERDMQEGQPT